MCSSNNELLSRKHDIIIGKFLPNISSNMCFIKTIATPFINARVSAARVLLVTLWIFLDCQNIGASKLFFSFRKIKNSTQGTSIVQICIWCRMYD